MPKLHELLAVEGQLKGQAQATRTELKATFEKKRHLFEEKRVTFKPNEEGVAETIETQSDLQSKVPDELVWIAGIWGKALDVSYQVAEANMYARADVVLDDGTQLLKGVPATALLELEKRGAEVQELIKSIPTLDPAKGFRPDDEKGANVYRARDVQKHRTKKIPQVITKAAATEHHPAQAEIFMADVQTGTVVEQEWSGLVTPAQKGELLERAETITRAFKQARQRANEVNVDAEELKCGKAVFDYVFSTNGNGKH